MMIYILIGILFCIFSSICFMLGLLIASTKINRYEYIEDKLPLPKVDTYKVEVRYLQSKGYIKTFYMKGTCKEDVIAQALQLSSQKELKNSKVYSIVSVEEYI